MKVVRDTGGDYYAYVSQREIDTLVVKSERDFLGRVHYPWLSSFVYDQGGSKTDEWLGLTCSKDTNVARGNNGFLFRRQEDPKDMNVLVFPARISKQEDLVHHRKDVDPFFETIYTQRYLMDRVDDLSQKFWLFLDEELSQDVA